MACASRAKGRGIDSRIGATFVTNQICLYYLRRLSLSVSEAVAGAAGSVGPSRHDYGNAPAIHLQIRARPFGDVGFPSLRDSSVARYVSTNTGPTATRSQILVNYVLDEEKRRNLQFEATESVHNTEVIQADLAISHPSISPEGRRDGKTRPLVSLLRRALKVKSSSPAAFRAILCTQYSQP